MGQLMERYWEKISGSVGPMHSQIHHTKTRCSGQEMNGEPLAEFFVGKYEFHQFGKLDETLFQKGGVDR